jgi:hypothetical protein
MERFASQLSQRVNPSVLSALPEDDMVPRPHLASIATRDPPIFIVDVLGLQLLGQMIVQRVGLEQPDAALPFLIGPLADGGLPSISPRSQPTLSLAGALLPLQSHVFVLL